MARATFGIAELLSSVQVLKMKILAIIPARANSSRVPGKNTMRLGPDGKPNLVRAIEAVSECVDVEVVAVVSDDPKTCALARLHGCYCLVEPPHVAKHGDLYDVMDFVCRHVPKGIYDAVILAYPNVPIRPAGLFPTLVEEFRVSEKGSVAAIVPGRGHAGGSVFGWNYLQALIETRKVDVKFLHYRQDQIVEIDSLEDVTWANTLLNANDYQRT